MHMLKEGSDDTEELSKLLHQFLYSVFADQHPASSANFYNCTITRHTMLNQLQKDLIFKRPGVMSSSIAGDQYCMRLVFMYEMMVAAEELVDETNPDSFPDYVG
jgi:hypothetical protein